MKKTLILFGPHIPKTKLGLDFFGKKPFKIISSDKRNKPIPFDRALQQKPEFDSVILSGHSNVREGKFLINLFETKDILEPTFQDELLEQIAQLHRHNGATNFYISSCYSGAFINYIQALSQTNPEKLTALGLTHPIKIMVFTGSKNYTIMSEGHEIIKKISQYDGDADDEIARSLSLKLAVTVKSCTIANDGRFEIGTKHNLNKYPELYKKLKNPDNEIYKREWYYLSERYQSLKDRNNLTTEEELELKKLDELFTLYEKYKDLDPTQIPKSFIQDAFIESTSRGKCSRMDGWLSLGADINFIDKENNTILHFAAGSCSAETLKYLIGKSESLLKKINQTNNKGKTALHVAAEMGNMEALEYLISNGAELAKINSFGRTPFHKAAENDHVPIMERLSENWEAKEIYKNLIHAVNNNWTQATKFLCNKIKDTPFPYIDKINLGASNNALHIAAKNNNLKLIKLLLNAGANPCAKNIFGRQAIEITTEKEIKDFLEPIYYLQNELDKIFKPKGTIIVGLRWPESDFSKDPMPILSTKAALNLPQILKDAFQKNPDNPLLNKLQQDYTNIASKNILPCRKILINQPFADIMSPNSSPRPTSIQNLPTSLPIPDH